MSAHGDQRLNWRKPFSTVNTMACGASITIERSTWAVRGRNSPTTPNTTPAVRKVNTVFFNRFMLLYALIKVEFWRGKTAGALGGRPLGCAASVADAAAARPEPRLVGRGGQRDVCVLPGG